MDLTAGNPELVKLLRRQIGGHGPVTFKWFMQQALYHPQHGFYGGGRARIGRRGDFYTNVSVGKIYGQMMARQFEEMWRRMNSPESFAIVEEGAHGGQLANDVLAWLEKNAPDLFAKLRYWIVEPNEKWQAEQQSTLSVWPRNKVRWRKSLAEFEAGSLCGVHFSNELLDAFPVHLVTTAGGEWQENFVDINKDGFRWVYGPISNGALNDFLMTLGSPVDLTAGGTRHYRTEVNLAAQRWVEDVAKILSYGYVLAADYGYSRAEYYSPARHEGTLMGYREHERNPDPLGWVGESDLTTHVDFTSLAERAESNGLRLTGFCDQHHFMIGLGESELLHLEKSLGAMTPEKLHYIRSFKTLMHPSSMGMAFKFICFDKNVENVVPLAGLRHAANGRDRLGLASASTGRAASDDPYAAF